MPSNLRKAAVLLMSLPPDEAARLLALLEPTMVEAVSIEIARTEHVGASEQDAVADEFAETKPPDDTAAGLHIVRGLLERALGTAAGETIDQIRQTIEPPFAPLYDVPGGKLLVLLRDEHPQTVALVLAHLSPSQGAEILAGLSTERQLSVIRRVANLGRVSPTIVREVADSLQRQLCGTAHPPLPVDGGVTRIVEILNTADRDTQRRLLENLFDEDPELFREIRRRLGAVQPQLHRAA